MADTHTVMPKKLAQALMEAGMQHFDIGGMVNQNRTMGVGGGLAGGIGDALGTNNNFQAAGVDNIGNIQQQYGQQQDIYGQQQALAAQLLAQTQGGGPGNALVAQQGANQNAAMAATMAGARGASANPGLIARNAALAGQQGNQQVLNAQTQMELQSQNALANQQAQMANQALQGQSIGQGAIAAANNVNAGVAGQNASQNSGMLGGLLGGLSGGLLSKGGEVKKMAVGGQVNDNIGIANYGGSGVLQLPGPNQQLQKSFGGLGGGLTSFLGGGGDQGSMNGMQMAGGPMDAMGGGGGLGGDLGLLALASKGGQAGVTFGQMLAGGNVPGKANVEGDSEKNDTVPTMLSPGEVVIPRSIAQSDDAPAKAAEFMKHLKSKKKRGYAGIAEARRGRVS